MPVAVLIALLIAFGVDSPDAGLWSAGMNLPIRVSAAWLGVAFVGLASWSGGALISRRVRHTGALAGIDRRLYTLLVRGSEALAILSYAWVIHVAGWRSVVADGFGLRKAIVADEALILLPFIVAQLICWCGIYPAERAVRSIGVGRGSVPRLGRFVALKARQSFALVLPAALLLLLTDDLLRRLRPDLAGENWVQMAEMAVMAGFVVFAAPLFVRIMWPSRSMPKGVLRSRLERLCARHAFRCTDILIWDTGGAIVNAGVTGVVPWFRYVLLTDLLIEKLEPRQVEAVFGHEMGHIAKRHFPIFGLFFVAGAGVIALIAAGVRATALRVIPLSLHIGTINVLETTQIVLTLVVAGLCFFEAFGRLSRRLEREADVFGCRAASCGRPECPPHRDEYAGDDDSGEVDRNPRRLCPVGIRAFAESLVAVSELNGLNVEARSWRHGGIAKRIAFVESLELNPDRAARFESQSRRLRFVLVFAVAASVSLAYVTGAWRLLLGQ